MKLKKQDLATGTLLITRARRAYILYADVFGLGNQGILVELRPPFAENREEQNVNILFLSSYSRGLLFKPKPRDKANDAQHDIVKAYGIRESRAGFYNVMQTYAQLLALSSNREPLSDEALADVAWEWERKEKRLFKGG